MIRYNRKGAYAQRKLFILDDGTIYTIPILTKKDHKRYKKFLKKYYR